MATPTFGIFDHIEDIPGTPTAQLFKDRLELIKMADEAGFAGYHLAEHHGSDLCMAPNQEVFIAAASQVTKNIRLGPLVKLLPLHHPVRIIEDMIVVDNLTNGRLDFGVGRGVAPIEHYWFGSKLAPSRRRASRTPWELFATLSPRARSRARTASSTTSPTVPLATKPFQDPIPFWYPGSPVTAGRHGMSLMWPGPIDEQAYESSTSRRGASTRATRCELTARTASRESAARCCLRSPRRRPRRSTSPAAAWTASSAAPHIVHKHDHEVLAGRRMRRGPRPVARDHGPHRGRDRCRRGHGRPDRRALRRHPRAGPDGLHRPPDPNG